MTGRFASPVALIALLLLTRSTMVSAGQPLGQFAVSASAASLAAASARPVAQLPQAVTPARVVWSSGRTEYPGHDTVSWGGAVPGTYGGDCGEPMECCTETPCEKHRCRLVEAWQSFWHNLRHRGDECPSECEPLDCEEQRHGLFSGHCFRNFWNKLTGKQECELIGDCCGEMPMESAGAMSGLEYEGGEMGEVTVTPGWDTAEPVYSAPVQREPATDGTLGPAETVVPRGAPLRQPEQPMDQDPQNWRSRRPAQGARSSRAGEVVPADQSEVIESPEGPHLGPFSPSSDEQNRPEGDEPQERELTASDGSPASTLWR